MTTFHVSLDGLSALVGRLATLAGELRDAKGATPCYAGQTGSDAVTAALDNFFAEWSDGMQIIDSNIAALSDKLTRSEDAYSAVECSLTQDMGAGGAL